MSKVKTAPKRPRTEDTLEGRFQLLVDTVVDYGIFMLDPQGHLVSWNSGAEKLKGHGRDAWRSWSGPAA